MQYDPTLSEGWRPNYKLLSGSILPRAIAFVSTADPQGHLNLAPFSFFTVACANPPTVLFCPMRRGDTGGEKDTLKNIRQTGDFVVNIVTESIAEQMNRCATEFPHEISEFDEAGLTPVASVKVKAPRVAESPISMECQLKQIIDINDQPGGGSIVLGEVVLFHLEDEIVDDFRVNLERLRPIGRLAGSDYTYVRDLFSMDRIPYQTPV